MNTKLKPNHSKYVFSLFLFLVLAIISFQSSVYSEIQVYFNTNTYKIHKLDCHWGKKCTKSCIIIPRSEAYKKGGVACKVCGG